MNSKNESKLKMLLALRIFLKTNDAIASKLPNYAKFLLALDTAIGEIQGNSENLQLNTSGVAGNKKQQRQLLEITTEDASNKVQAYAKFTNNTVLTTEVKFKMSTLQHVSDLELVNSSKVVYKKIAENLEALSPYSLTAETQTAYKELIDAYEVAIPKGREIAVDKKSTKQQLNQAFEAAADAVDNIDTLVEIVKLTEPGFYAGYKETRKVVSAASGSLAAQGTVLDAASGLAVAGATLTFRLNGDDEPVLVKQSADKGGFKIKSLDEGVYNVTVTKIGYQTQILQLTVSSTELSGLEVRLVKA